MVELHVIDIFWSAAAAYDKDHIFARQIDILNWAAYTVLGESKKSQHLNNSLACLSIVIVVAVCVHENRWWNKEKFKKMPHFLIFMKKKIYE